VATHPADRRRVHLKRYRAYASRAVQRGRLLSLVVILATVAFNSAAAQDDTSYAANNAPRVTSVDFEGAELFTRQQLLSRVRTQRNRRLFGIPGANWWLFLYRTGESGALGSGLGRVLMASGEAPALLDSSVVGADVERLRALYQQEGYRNARVEADVQTHSGGRLARVTFRIDAGDVTWLRRVSFEGLDRLSSDRRDALLRQSLLHSRRAEWVDSTSFVASDRRYSEPTLVEERRRILNFLRDEGFAAVARDSIRAIIFPERPDSFDVLIQVSSGPRYRFGDVRFVVEGPEGDVGLRTDSIRIDVSEGQGAPGVISTVMIGEGRLSPALLYRSMQFEPGDWFNQSELLATKRRLDASGVFAFTDLVPRHDLRPRNQIVPALPYQIEARTRPRHQVRFETFMLQRTGLVASENEVGAGVGVTYENANLFGGGETFRIRTTGSIAADVDSTILSSAQAEITTSITFPYFLFPFGALDRQLNLYDARTRVSLNLLSARRDNLALIIRGRGTALFRLEGQHSPTVTSYVDLLDLSISNPDTLTGFSEIFLDRVFGGNGDGRPVLDPVQQAQILEDYTQPQINNALRYTVRSSRANLLRRNRGYIYEGALEVGGNLPYVLDRYVFSPGEVEGSLPGLPFFGGDRDSRLLYRQYMRGVIDARQYRPIGPGTVLSGKLIGGFAAPLGQSNVIPFDRRFYAGGGSSVRGWGLRLLGPGAARFGEVGRADDFTNILGGDIKLEAGVELRQTLIRNLLAADWMLATFADAGNVWFGSRNPGFGDLPAGLPDGRFRASDFLGEIGIGSGLGVRLAWDYLVLRLDVAVKVHDPTRSGFLPDGLNRPVAHFGIGHAF
jgi:outer membrane protein insertion porin family